MNEEPQPVVVCGDAYAMCSCLLPKEHENATHACECGGAWRVDPDGTVHAVRYPDIFAAMGLVP